MSALLAEAPSLYGATYVEPCFYCGLPADTVDHVIPQSLIADLRTLGDPAVTQLLYTRHRVKMVPACRECNSAIGNQYFDTLGKRKAWIKAWLRRRYAKALKMPPWSPSELHAVSRNLQGYVERGLDQNAGDSTAPRVARARAGGLHRRWVSRRRRGASRSTARDDVSSRVRSLRWGCLRAGRRRSLWALQRVGTGQRRAGPPVLTRPPCRAIDNLASVGRTLSSPPHPGADGAGTAGR